MAHADHAHLLHSAVREAVNAEEHGMLDHVCWAVREAGRHLDALDRLAEETGA